MNYTNYSYDELEREIYIGNKGAAEHLGKFARELLYTEEEHQEQLELAVDEAERSAFESGFDDATNGVLDTFIDPVVEILDDIKKASALYFMPMQKAHDLIMEAQEKLQEPYYG